MLRLHHTSIPLNGNIVIGFFILLFLLGQAHQLIHHSVGGILCGQVGYLTFDRHHFAEALSQSVLLPVATIAGPLFSHYGAMWIGMYLLNSGKYILLGFSLIFACMPVGRLLAVLGGDEQYYGVWISQLFGSPEEYSTVISLLVTAFIILPPLVTAYKSLAHERTWIVFASLLLVPLIFYIVVIMLPDHAFLLPSVEKAIETGASPHLLVSMFWGLPLILILVTLALTALFFGKYLHYLLPEKGRP